MTAKEKLEINKIPLFDSKGRKTQTMELDGDIFNGKFSEALLHQSIVMYQANKRMGTASTKTRGDVRGGGKKPWRQKGTGRARVGSTRNPVWRKGGIAFGPHPRDFSYSLPKTMRRNAFLASINAKLKAGNIYAVEDITIDAPKTKKVYEILNAMKLKNKTLFLVAEKDNNLMLAARNIENLDLKLVNEATAYDVLSNNNVVITKKAMGILNKRVKK